jgi:hypothetical protein
MSEKRGPEHELIATHIASTTAAFQVLVQCLQDNGALRHGQYPEALRLYMEITKQRTDSEGELAMLHHLRLALMD